MGLPPPQRVLAAKEVLERVRMAQNVQELYTLIVKDAPLVPVAETGEKARIAVC